MRPVVLAVLACSGILCLLEPAAPAAGGAPRDDARAVEVRELIDQGQYTAAETAARELLAATETRSGSESLATARAIDLLVENLAKAVKGSEPDARVLGERAVRIKEKLLGPGDPEIAVSLNNLGAVLRLNGDNPRARAS